MIAKFYVYYGVYPLYRVYGVCIYYIKYTVEGMWCVSTIRADRKLGSKEQLKTKKSAERSWQKLNRLACRYQLRDQRNRVVQLASTSIGHEQRNKVKRWSATENKTIEIECPAMLEEFYAHMGSLTFATRCFPLNRMRSRTCMYYMHTPLQIDGCYIGDIANKSTSQKRPNGFVSISVEHCKCSSIWQQEKGYPQARPSFIISNPQWSFSRQEALLCSISYLC